MKHILTYPIAIFMVFVVTLCTPTDGYPATSEGGGIHLSEQALTLWKDPVFQKRFIESYVAETEIEPRLTVDERDTMQKILALISTDKMSDAVKMLEKSINNAASAVFDFTLANIFFQQEELDKAVTGYDAAIAKFPKFRRAWKNLGLIHVRLGAFKESLPALTRVVELGGHDSVTYGLLGYAYASVDNYLSAESAYRMAILLDPETMDWKMGLIRSFFKQERFSESAALCGQLLQQYPDRTDLWLLQANAYIGLKQPLQAAENYEIVDQLGQSTFDTLNMLGDIYVNEDLFEMAVVSYIKAMDKAPDAGADRAIRSSKILIARGALQETRQLLAHINQLHGDTLKAEDKKDVLKLQARLAVADGAGDEEVAVLTEIAALDPLDGEAFILLGQHSQRAGDLEKAVFYFERAASIEKYEADANVRHAQLLVSQGKYTEALPLLRRAHYLKPNENIQKYLEQVERVAKTR